MQSMDGTVSCHVALAFAFAPPPKHCMNIAVLKCTKRKLFFLFVFFKLIHLQRDAAQREHAAEVDPNCCSVHRATSHRKTLPFTAALTLKTLLRFIPPSFSFFPCFFFFYLLGPFSRDAVGASGRSPSPSSQWNINTSVLPKRIK